MATYPRIDAASNHAHRMRAVLLAIQVGLCSLCSAAHADVLSDALSTMAPNSWKRINLNQFRDVWTPLAQRVTGPTPESNISAWSGATWDNRRRNLLIWGGDQGLFEASDEGNEFYIFHAATGLWERGALPSQVTFTNGIAHTVDGIFSAPTSCESWDNVIYLGNVDRVAIIGCSREGLTFRNPLTGEATGPYFWDPMKADANKVSGTTGSQVNPAAFPNVVGGQMWQNRDNFPADTGLGLGGVTAYVNRDGKDVVYFSGQRDNLWRYTVQDLDPANDRWELIGRRPWSGVDSDGAGALDPTREIFVKTLSANSFGFWDVGARAVSPENRENEIFPTLVSGSPAIDFRDFGMQYDPTVRAFLLWGGNSEVWQLDPPTNLDPDGDGIQSEASGWTLRRIVPAGTGPTLPANYTGVFGKWVYLPDERAYLGVIDPIAGDVFLYKPTYNDPRTDPAVVLTANPASVPTGGTSRLTWSSTNATSCEASGGWSGSKPTSGSATTGPLATSTAYSLSCTGPSGTVVSTVTITVAAPAEPPTLALSATPTAVALDGHASLAWTSSGATSCTATGGPWSGTKPVQGSETVGPLSSSAAFTLSCTGIGGTKSLSVTVNVVAAPSLQLAAAPDSVPAGGMSQLTWSATNATSCQASGGWGGSKPSSGSATIGPLVTSTAYSLSCTGLSGTTVESILVTVVGTAAPPTLALSATPTSVPPGGQTSLEWKSSGATSCVAAGVPWTGAKPTQGLETVQPLSSSAEFSLSCTGIGGSTTQLVTVSVVAPPSVQFTASPVSVSTGTQTSLTWSSIGASACVAGGAWAGTKAANGSEQSAPLNSNETFELECSGTGGTTRVSATVTVLPASSPSGPSGGNSKTSGGGGAADLLLGLGLAGLSLIRRRRTAQATSNRRLSPDNWRPRGSNGPRATSGQYLTSTELPARVSAGEARHLIEPRKRLGCSA